jgi:hypothetical protein
MKRTAICLSPPRRVPSRTVAGLITESSCHVEGEAGEFALSFRTRRARPGRIRVARRVSRDRGTPRCACRGNRCARPAAAFLEIGEQPPGPARRMRAVGAGERGVGRAGSPARPPGRRAGTRPARRRAGSRTAPAPAASVSPPAVAPSTPALATASGGGRRERQRLARHPADAAADEEILVEHGVRAERRVGVLEHLAQHRSMPASRSASSIAANTGSAPAAPAGRASGRAASGCRRSARAAAAAATTRARRLLGPGVKIRSRRRPPAPRAAASAWGWSSGPRSRPRR